MQNAIKEITMIRTFAALAAVLTVGAVQAADMNMDMSGHDDALYLQGPQAR